MVSDPSVSSDASITHNDMTPEEVEEARKAFLLKRFWISARGFWGRQGDRLAWPLSIGLLVMIGINVGFQYGINVWNRGLFDAIEQRNAEGVYSLGSIFPFLVLGSVGLVSSQVYVRMRMQRRWRSWLTKGLTGRWLASGRYYQLNLIDGDHQNPEARISEDMRIATEAPVDFTAGVISAFVSASTFIVVLWTIGGALTLQIAGSTVTIPGFLVIAAVVYAIITSSAIAFIGRNFVKVSETKNQVEAEFRYTLTRVRENGESIALLGGEEEERDDLDRRFFNVRTQWRLLSNQYMRTSLVSHSSMLIAPVVPVLLCAPKFLDGSMSLGQVMQAASAFTIVQGAFGWLVDNYPRLADWNACARRVASLMMSLDGLEQAEKSDTVGRIQRGETTDNTMLSLSDLSVSLGDGTAVVKETEVQIQPGERVLVAGESGSGKSTLVRARWCGPLPASGLGAVDVLISIPSINSSCFHKSLTFRPALFAVPSPIPAQPIAGARRRFRLRWTRSVLASLARKWRKKRLGTTHCQAVRSSGSPSPGFCFTSRISSYWMKRPLLLMTRRRTRSWPCSLKSFPTRPFSALRTASSLRLFTPARSRSKNARVAQSWSAISASCSAIKSGAGSQS
jgi:vitamin B12/bleomycin/antimicrobial peptide transport system ATP-binding/permease protein